MLHNSHCFNQNQMKLLYVDLFCGAGGTSTGVEAAEIEGYKCAKVIACVNHDANAIASHASNHPDALHFTEDIRTLELSPLISHIEKCRRIYPDSLLVLWASLECTNFSKAKGGMPRDADSRTLAEHLFRYIEAIKPDYIQIENVEEFMSWGDVDENGKPVSMDKGKSYIRWVRNVKKYGYKFDHRILNAADYGAYTSRKRFFGVFAKHGLPIVFPVPTHCKGGETSLFGSLDKWRPVRECLDFNDEGESIFARKKPLVEATLERIYAGLIKFVAGGNPSYDIKWDSNGTSFARRKVAFLSKQFSGSPKSKNISVEEPAGAITTKDHHAFISAYYGNGHNHSCDDPCPVITTKDRMSLVTSHFIANEYSGGGQLSDPDMPSPAILTTPKQKLVTVNRFLMNPQYSSAGGSVDSPCFTLIARMDKMPPYLISTETGDLAIEVYESDTPMMVKIKEFMAHYNIVDIKMRMLRILELKRIMGFPDDYILVGTQAEQKKYIGNAVEVNMARSLCLATYKSIIS